MSSLLQRKIVDSCKRIGDYILSVTNKRFFIKRMRLLFKVDQHDKLALVLCTSLKVEMNCGMAPRSFQRHIDPHNRETRFRLSDKYASVQKDRENELRLNLQVNSLFATDTFSLSRGTSCAGGSRKCDRCVFCRKPLSKSKRHLSYRQLIDLNTCYCEAFVPEKVWEVPRVLLRLKPKLTKGEYLASMANEEWLENRAGVCVDCWEQVNSLYFSGRNLCSSVEGFRTRPFFWAERLMCTVGLQHQPQDQAFSFDNGHSRPEGLTEGKASSPRTGKYGQLLDELCIDPEAKLTPKLQPKPNVKRAQSALHPAPPRVRKRPIPRESSTQIRSTTDTAKMQSRPRSRATVCENSCSHGGGRRIRIVLKDDKCAGPSQRHDRNRSEGQRTVPRFFSAHPMDLTM